MKLAIKDEHKPSSKSSKSHSKSIKSEPSEADSFSAYDNHQQLDDDAQTFPPPSTAATQRAGMESFGSRGRAPAAGNSRVAIKQEPNGFADHQSQFMFNCSSNFDNLMHASNGRKSIQNSPSLSSSMTANMLKRRDNRMAVYSGATRTHCMDRVYRLEDLCIHVLMNHINSIGHVGPAPFYLLKPVLSKCTVQQLRRIEFENEVSCFFNKLYFNLLTCWYLFGLATSRRHRYTLARACET